jgi:hypothetical protein
MQYDPKAQLQKWNDDFAGYWAQAKPGQEVDWADGELVCWGNGADAVYKSPVGDLAFLVRGMSPSEMIGQGNAGKYLGALWACQYGLNPFSGQFDGYAFGGQPPKL